MEGYNHPERDVNINQGIRALCVDIYSSPVLLKWRLYNE